MTWFTLRWRSETLLFRSILCYCRPTKGCKFTWCCACVCVGVHVCVCVSVQETTQNSQFFIVLPFQARTALLWAPPLVVRMESSICKRNWNALLNNLFFSSMMVSILQYKCFLMKYASNLKCVIWFSSNTRCLSLISSKRSFSSTVTVPIPSGLKDTTSPHVYIQHFFQWERTRLCVTFVMSWNVSEFDLPLWAHTRRLLSIIA